MSKIEVLVACMYQTGDDLYKEMNLSTDAIFANQCDEFSYREYTEGNGCTAKLISTAERGVGKNRNKALSFASGDYILCSDQDMIYVDNYAEIIENAFKKCPKADIIVFNLEYLNRFTPGRKASKKFKRIHFWNSMRYGTARVAMRRAAVEKACLSFSVLYGGGAKYSSGEDSLFIREALRKGLKMYYCPEIIAKVKQEESSWFKGYNEKFFVDKGILIANAFPILKHVLIYYFAYRMKNLSKEFGFAKICKLMRKGFKDYKNI